MENRSYSQAISSAYMSSLAAQYAIATDYHGVSHPSLPNYLALTSGTTWGIADDGFHALPAGGLGSQLTNAGIAWRAYMESMTNGCFQSPYPYALKHNPFAYYGSACPPQVVPFTQFASDLSGNTPQFSWITPNLCNDGHDCSSSVADAWLSQTVPAILNSNAWQDGGMLVITWDEGEDSANSVLTLVIRPNPLNHRARSPTTTTRCWRRSRTCLASRDWARRPRPPHDRPHRHQGRAQAPKQAAPNRRPSVSSG